MPGPGCDKCKDKCKDCKCGDSCSCCDSGCKDQDCKYKCNDSNSRDDSCSCYNSGCWEIVEMCLQDGCAMLMQALYVLITNDD